VKVMTLFGTRPEIIRLSEIIKRLDALCKLVLVHTGQNYGEELSDVFFRELTLRRPDVHLGVRGADFAQQVAQIMAGAGEVLSSVQPDRLLVLGDTNSGLSAIVAARLGIPVYHLEAGNRCYDWRVPEEINRRLIDHCSAILMTYTHRSKENLLREGIERERIFVVGNPIYEVLEAHKEEITASSILGRLGVEPRRYFVMTLHRAENVDRPERLRRLLEGIVRVPDKYGCPVIVSMHPHTASKLDKETPDLSGLRLLPPLGFHDFVALERQARCVISDSGTVQEECTIFGVPSVTIRDVTERAETIECGGNIVTGDDPETILSAIDTVLGLPCDWTVPAEYLEKRVSTSVTKILLGYHHQKS
jgi:UDP-N-acetylglucosamine 2-epimerase (non-hydrolysing)